MTNEAVEIVRQLYDLEQSRLPRPFTDKEHVIRHRLTKLAETGEAGALLSVASILSSHDETTLRCLRHTIGIVFGELSPRELLHFEDSINWRHGWYFDHSRGHLKPLRIAEIAGDQTEQGHTHVLGLFTFHKNGFVRHEAVRQLSKLKDGSELPYLLLRQNDWVMPVAKEAQAAVALRIKDDYAADLARWLRIILHMNSMSRHDHRDTIAKIADILLAEHNDAMLRSAIESVDCAVNAICPFLSAVSPDDLIAVAVDHNSIFARRTAVDLLAKSGKWRSLPALIRIATEADAEIAAYAEGTIQNACRSNRVFTAPSRECRQTILDILDSTEMSYNSQTFDLVKAELNRFG